MRVFSGLEFFQKFFALCLTLILITSPLNAEEQAYDDNVLVEETKSDLITVVGAGAGGAVLGLSTLSFVDQPKDHLKNIMYGAAIGIIVGVIFVAYKQATKTHESYDSYARSPSLEFNTQERLEFHSAKAQDVSIASVWQVGHQWNF